MELIALFKYEEARVTDPIRLSREDEIAKLLWTKIPQKFRDNKIVAIFKEEKDAWGHEHYIAAMFHDFNLYLGEYDQVKAYYSDKELPERAAFDRVNPKKNNK